MDPDSLEQKVLDLVNRPGYQPLKPRAIARKLGVPKDQAGELKRLVKRLVGRGRLAYGASHLVQPGSGAAPVGNRVVGVFRRTQGGFGFVRPAGAARGDESVQDVYIPAKRSGDASTGDTVVVLLGKRGGKQYPGPRGEIVEVVNRETHQFVGTYFERAGTAYVQVDGTLFAQPICVGDPGAKDARVDNKVVFEMVRFPSHLHDGEGVITEVLGPRGKPGVDTLSIIREFNLPEGFAPDALEEARRRAEQFNESIAADRRDLTGETVVTIDPVDARDFDDAISLERLPNGNWLLGVHIADVSHFVEPRTPLDREARERSTSVYLPDRVLPMLPEIISNALASLQPGKVRYTKSALMEYTPEGLRVAADFCSSAIRSSKRLAYEQVDEFLTDREAWRKKLGAKVHDLLGRMHELAMTLRRRRLEHGALELVMPEVKVDLDREGRVSGAHVVENTESHQIIEEFMLAANEAVAERLRDAEVGFLRRVHKQPALRKLRALSEFVAELGIKTQSLESRFELQKLLQQVTGCPQQHAVHYAVLRSMQRAVYSPEEEGHYALASDCYCHFTSPIRRYPDLTVHRLLGAILAGEKPASDDEQLAVLGQHCSDLEQRAEAAERDLVKMKLLAYLSDRIGEEMDAVVTGVESFGLFAQGLELPAEGLIRVDSLLDDFYQFDRAAHTLAGRRSGNQFRLGDVLRVAVVRVDLERRELDFRVVGQKETRAGAGKTGTTVEKPPAGKRRPPSTAPRQGQTKSKRRGRRG
jgi:ribonuclease R